MARPRSNSLGALPTHSTLAQSPPPVFLESRAATDLHSWGSNTLVSQEPSSPRPRLELNTSQLDNEPEIPSERFESRSNTEAQQDRTSPIPEARRRQQVETTYNDAPSNGPWERKIGLTCDGGGIRGYASALMIAELMKHIGRLERDHRTPHFSSFAPCKRAPALKARESGFQDVEGALTSDYLPCHYFDYMVGTSTGGLISIMLSRWRMSITDCLEQYVAFGPEVFGHPRKISIVGFPHDKYHKAPLVNVVKRLTEEKTPPDRQGDGDRFRLFPAPSDLCRSAVVANSESHNRCLVGPHLFRSYKVDLPPDTPPDLQPRNWRVPANHEIWEVCRATTAAPTYFRPTKIGDKIYSDGGIGTNNPTIEAIDEIDRLHKNCLEILVSFGTGMPEEFSGTKKKFGLAKLFLVTSQMLKTSRAALTDCEKTHENVLRHARRAKGTPGEFQYFRFNVRDGLGKMALDEWKVKRDWTASGKRITTFDSLHKHTQAELDKQSVQDDLRNLAEMLVRRRRERANDVLDLGHWERFACCTTYKCFDGRCRIGGEELSFNFRGQMREHLRSEHSLHAPDLRIRLDQCRRLPEFSAGPY